MILQSIRKGNTDGEHAACPAWDSSGQATDGYSADVPGGSEAGPILQSPTSVVTKQQAATRNGLASDGSTPTGESSTAVPARPDLCTLHTPGGWVNRQPRCNHAVGDATEL